jgi:hypothetical protein
MEGDRVTFTTPTSRPELEWPCRLAGYTGCCPICASRGDTPGDKAHRRAVLEAASRPRRNRK